MSDYTEKAEAIFSQGYNCAQAVFGAFAEEYGLDMATAMRVSSSLGGGIGHSGEACGAALGMVLALGVIQGYGEEAPSMEEKTAHNANVKAMMDAFRERFGAMDCDDLREVGNRELCVGYVRYATELVEKKLAE